MSDQENLFKCLSLPGPVNFFNSSSEFHQSGHCSYTVGLWAVQYSSMRSQINRVFLKTRLITYQILASTRVYTIVSQPASCKSTLDGYDTVASIQILCGENK